MSLNDLRPQDQTSLSPPARAYIQSTLDLAAAAYSIVRNTIDIPYGDDERQKVDVFYPDTIDQPLPVLVFMHGGGWTHGYKEQCAFMAPAITALSAILVSVSYRLAPEVRFPTPLEDVVSALAWVKENIARFGGDPDAIFLGGHSAGGHLATMVTLQTSRLTAAGLPANLVKGCLPVSASFEFAIGMLEAEGKFLLEKPEDALEASPVNSIGEPGAPFHIVWGERDFARCLNSTGVALDTFQRKGWSVTSRCFPQTDHFQAHLDLLEPRHGWLQAFADMAGIPTPRATIEDRV